MKLVMKKACLGSGLLAFLLFSASSWAGVAGQVTHLSGTLSARTAEGSSRLLSVNSDVQEGELLTTEKGTYARVKFVDGAEVVLRPASQLRVSAYHYAEHEPKSDNILLNLLKGGLRAVTGLIGKRNRSAVSVNTPTATIGIRGTHFGALFCQQDCADVPNISGQPLADGLHVDVASGAIVLRNNTGEQLISAGQFGFAPSSVLPPVVVPPSEGVQVTMPPSISQNEASGAGIGQGADQSCVAR